jgi:glycosyltransferase involved in cell wall biosynthesis
MNVILTSEQHFKRTPDGRVWTEGQFSYWTRYLSVFDSVRVVARMREVKTLLPNFQPASGPKLTFSGVPDYLGPEQYLLRSMSVASATARAIQDGDAIILRVPGQMGWCVEGHLRKMRRPYAVEVVGDPYDVFAPGAIRHPLRPLFRWWSSRRLRQVCRRACAATYVTEETLQRRYPPGPKTFATHCSDVELSPTSFLSAPRSWLPKAAVRLLFVGSLAQVYKAPDVLIDAVAECVRDGLSLELVLVGSGRYQPELELRAAALGLGNQVQFRGQLATLEAVRGELDRADIFVLPSRTEGLPRAMIEAMARALPCIGSIVGGIPELLPAEDTVPPNDPPALARKIREVITDPARMARMSARNLAKAREYADATLTDRRQAFYQSVRACNQAWLEAKR